MQIAVGPTRSMILARHRVSSVERLRRNSTYVSRGLESRFESSVKFFLHILESIEYIHVVLHRYFSEGQRSIVKIIV